ncbi:fibronectin-binding protein A N-terminus-domain-containing protein [Kalaharituber pfeilii]|nr:fibronectin-binding protein A N-terminus-domain-containing protein [Kalaharituber pfeilii]
MKQRYTSLDLQVIAQELSQTITNFRLSNIYDISSRIFLLKFALPNSKHLLLVDSGFRCHLTSFSRTTSPSPSSFVARLRKHLRTRRLTSVRQIGIDRVLELTFSDGKYKLYLEFYAGGNVVLVNEEGICIAVLRIVPAGDGRGETKVGAPYLAPAGEEGVLTGGGEIGPAMVIEAIKSGVAAPPAEEEAETAPPAPAGEQEKQGKTKPGQGKKYKKKKGEDSLKRVLGAKLREVSPVLVEHALIISGVDPEIRAEDILTDDALLEKVVQALIEARNLIDSITKSKEKVKGYIIAKQHIPKDEKAASKDGAKKNKHTAFGEIEGLLEDEEDGDGPEMKIDAEGFRYNDFHPFLPKQFVDAPGFKVTEVEGFNNTVDTFFSSIESLKVTSRLQDRKLAAIRKLTNAHSEHKSRVSALQSVQTLNERKARTIEINLEKVEEAISAVNSLIYQGVDWKDIEFMIANARRAGNPVAEIVEGLKLDKGVLTLLLNEVNEEEEDEESEDEDEDKSEEEEESDDEEEKEGRTKKKETQKLKIDVKLALTGWANAREYYTEKKTAAVKEGKTIQSSTKALKNTERKVLADLKKGLNKEKALLRPVRKQMWFEKFYYFISTDGYLVLGGRDAQQNELLYQRHFKRGDVYVSADVEGAAMLIVKNMHPHTQQSKDGKTTTPPPIPPTTLSQAGTFSICASKAWESKAIMSAWWVNWEQVSKTVKETGEYVPEPGRFVVDGVKNYLPPAQLVLGYGVLWIVGAKGEGEVEEGNAGRLEVGQEEERDEEGKEVAAEEKEDVEEEEEEENEQQEDSDDEEFPDVQIQSGDEESGDESAPVPTEEATTETSAAAGELLKPQSDQAEAPPDISTLKLDAAASDQAVAGDVPSPSPSTKTTTGKKYLSAKERRDLKKQKEAGQSPSSPALSTTPAPPPPPQPSKASKSQTGTTTTKSTTPQAQAQQLPRGKKHTTKYKKRLAEKYALQSDDEREIARDLLGVAVGSAQSGAATPSAVAGEGKDRKAGSKQDEKAAQEIAERQRKREQYLLVQASGKAAEARRFGRPLPPGAAPPPPPPQVRGHDLDAEEGVSEDEGEGGDELKARQGGGAEAEDESIDFTRLVGTPSPSTPIIDALPICAPYPALAKYKYKLKLLPAAGGSSAGVQKKGKLVKDIVYGWARLGEPARGGTKGSGSAGGGFGKGRGVGMGFVGWDEKGEDPEKMGKREWEVLKGWKVEEGVNCVPVGRATVVGGVQGGKGEGGKGGGGGSGAKGKEGKKEGKRKGERMVVVEVGRVGRGRRSRVNYRGVGMGSVYVYLVYLLSFASDPCDGNGMNKLGAFRILVLRKR